MGKTLRIPGLVLLLVLVMGPGILTQTKIFAEEELDTQIAVLAGEWKITYTHDAVRVYVIEKDGKVSGTANDEKLKGSITRKGASLLLTFEEDNKLERLTLGSDGRLFIEHYNPKDDFPDKKPAHIGIGVRQK